MSQDVSVSTQGVRRRLLAWFDRHKRDLPWRRTREPYAVWLSEMMLQQTQVATVIPYYERFVRRFPTVRKLAAARLDDVLGLWAGLGYYARARNLHRAARMVVEEFGGRFPRDVQELQRLPGVGRYSAGAIASIAFDVRAAVVDGNVVRVLARLFGIDEDVRAGAGRERAWGVAETILPRSRCGDFNQALMELGATVCLPGAAARCELCPLRKDCAAHAAGTVASLPVVTRKARVTEETHVVLAARSGDRWLFVRRPDDGLWGGLWALPSVVLNHDCETNAMRGALGVRGSAGASPSRATAQELADSLGLNGARVQSAAFCDVVRQLTHRRVRFVGYVCSTKAGGRLAPGFGGGRSIKWLTIEQAKTIGMSTAMRKVLAALAARLGVEAGVSSRP